MQRRTLLSGICASVLVPGLTWAEAGQPAFLSAARHPDGSYRLCALDEAGAILFQIPLPDRGHAAAAHPVRAEAVAFARRPGRFAILLDCVTGREIARLDPPEDRHFYGHGCFSSDGGRLFTTENDLETLEGRIGIWDATAGYTRIGDLPSGGTGPHDVNRLPGTDMLVIANGGMATHPDTGRTPLNLPTMQPNLAFLDPDTGLDQVIELEADLRLNSIRHLAVRSDGLVAAGLQWQGDEGEDPPLTLLADRGGSARLLEAFPPAQRNLQGYVGSISFTESGERVAITSPRGGVVHVFDVASGAFEGETRLEDVCGLAPASGGLFVTSGLGVTGALTTAGLVTHNGSEMAWDNHLVPVIG